MHNLAVRTATVKRGELKRNIETIGKITRVDPMARRTITPPIRGELLYIAEKYQGDMVEPGELLFTITSEKLVEMQTAYQTAFLDGDRATATSMIPELRKITFHTFRHWYATNLYHKTKNIIYVQRMLGHRRIQNTMIYIHIEEALFPEEELKTLVEYALTRDDITRLLKKRIQKRRRI